MAIKNGTPGNDDDALGGKSIVGTSENDIIHGLSGDDNIFGNGGAHDELFGDENNDFINASNGGNHLLDGGSGDDQLFGGDGLDTLIGGTGNDLMQGGGGNDSYNVDSSTDAIIEFANGGSDTVLSSVNFTLFDTVENLTLLGTNNLSGFGNSGNNIILGNEGNNLLGDNNPDDGVDSGDDFIDGAGGFDTLIAKADTSFDLTNTTLKALFASTTTIFGIESAIITAGGGNNVLDASQFTLGKVTLFGGAGNDSLRGGSGDDSLNGGNDNDRLTGGVGNDTIQGGDGVDTVQETGDFNFTVLSSRRLTGNGIDNLFGIEKVELTGGTGNSTFNASTATLLVTINGGGGNDTIIGGTKSDTLSGGDGDDKFAGGGGNNTMTGDAGSDRFIINTGRPFEAITSGFSFITDFTSGSDKIVLDKTTFTSLQSSVGNGLAANDFAIVTSGSNRSTAVTESNARIIYHTPTGSLIYNENGSAAGVGTGGGDFGALKNSPKLTASDFVVQSGSTDGLTGIPTTQLANAAVSFNGLAVGGIVKGNTLSNKIYTRGGDDIAMGGGGNDKIHGGSGNDIISGDQGRDILFGAAGWDTFVLAPNAGVDIIRDYQHGVDHLGLRELKFEQLRFEQQGSNAVIRNGTRDVAVLQGVQASRLVADDFVNVGVDKVNGLSVPVAIWA